MTGSLPLVAVSLPAPHRRLIMLIVLLTGIVLLWPRPAVDIVSGAGPRLQDAELQPVPAWLSSVEWPMAALLKLPMLSGLSPLTPALPVPFAEPGIRRYAIKTGDSLSSIFSRLGLSQLQMRQIMAADQSLLALDVLRPGHKLTFRLDDNQQVREMELYIHAGNRVIYQRDDSGEFSYQELLKEGQWHSATLSGNINGSFYLSAKQAGLSDADVITIQQLFQQRINFARDIQSGARFQVIRSDNYVGSEASGQSRIEAVRLLNRQQLHTAFLHANGQYYAENGDSLERSFLRITLARKYRISDDFNPRRLHPVTGRVRPHNGTDFATPTGTAVLAAAEGTVLRVEKHPYAGRYIEIQHQGQFKSRYLHLSSVLVRKGQHVGRGQRIALSGATGRVTGAHLHYELHINNRPVNPMTASIPLADAIPAAERSAFFDRVRYLLEQLQNDTLLAQQG
jgi:murein DD-endopeptidase